MHYRITRLYQSEEKMVNANPIQQNVLAGAAGFLSSPLK
tara:strand:+ start:4439 stop:4555 length:117 start_codon:yes stop_codon:yes gene_type:complete